MNIEVAEENCRRCHSMLTHNITFHETEDSKIQCTSCHLSVGHTK